MKLCHPIRCRFFQWLIPLFSILIGFLSAGANLALGKDISDKAQGPGLFGLAAPEFVKAFGNEAGNGRVITLAQDEQDLIWVGTETGLYTFDGYRYRLADFRDTNDKPLPKGWISNIYPAGDGIIWFGSFQDGLFRLDQHSKRYRQYRYSVNDRYSISSDRVSKILADGKKGLWVAGDHGLNYLDFSTQRFKHYLHPTNTEAGQLGNRTRELLRDNNGRLWVGSWNGLHWFDPISESFKELFTEQTLSLSKKIVRKLVQDSSGQVWIGTYDDGLYLYDSQQRLRRLVSDPRINDILQIRDDTIWTTSLEVGVSVYALDSGERSHIYAHDPSNPASPSANYSRGLLLDRAGQVWVGTADYGANRVDINNLFSRTLFPSTTDARQLKAKDIYSVLELNNGEIWFSSSGSGIDVLDQNKGRIRSYRANENQAGALPSNFILRMYQSKAGDIWLGTSGHGLLKHTPGSNTFEQFSLNDVSPVNTIIHINEDRHGDLVLSSGSNYFRFKVGSEIFEKIDFAQGTRSKINNVTASSPNGDVWVSSFKDLSIIRPGASQLQTVPLSNIGSEDPSFRIRGLNIFDNDEMILITSDKVFRARNLGNYQGGNLNFESITEHDAIIENVFETESGDYWGATAYIDMSRREVIALSQADGVYNQSQFLGSAIQTTSGELVFGGGFGATVMRPEHYKPWTFEPNVIITEAQVNGELWRGEEDNIIVKAGDSGFSVEYAALDYTAPLELRYKHRLLGFDDNWVNNRALSRNATYTNLSPGEYQLQIQASNRQGVWSPEIKSLTITVLPFWYQTLWFRLLTAVLAAAALWLALQYRVRQLQRQRRYLAKTVKQRTQELEASLEELHNTQDQLVSSQKNAALGRLVSGMAHELNTPMGVVKTGFSLVKEQAMFTIKQHNTAPLGPEQMRKKIEHLDRSCALVENNLEKMIALISNFKLVNADQDNPRPQRFMVMPFLEDILMPLKDRIKSVEAEVFITGEQNIYMNSYQGSLRHVLSELLANAINHAFTDHHQQGKTNFIEIRVQEAVCPDNEGEFSHYALISIRDNGAGISDDLLENIFDPFVAANTKDTGLGLHIVYNTITLQMHGEIQCESQIGSGTTIKLKIPSFRLHNDQAVPETQ